MYSGGYKTVTVHVTCIMQLVRKTKQSRREYDFTFDKCTDLVLSSVRVVLQNSFTERNTSSTPRASRTHRVRAETIVPITLPSLIE